MRALRAGRRPEPRALSPLLAATPAGKGRAFYPAVSFSSDRGFRFNFGTLPPSSSTGTAAAAAPGASPRSGAPGAGGGADFGFRHPPRDRKFLPLAAACFGGDTLPTSPTAVPPHSALLLEVSCGGAAAAVKTSATSTSSLSLLPRMQTGAGAAPPPPPASGPSPGSVSRGFRPPASSSSSSSSGSPSNSETTVGRPAPLCLRFSGPAGAYLCVPDSSDLSISGSMTVEALVQARWAMEGGVAGGPVPG